MKIREVRIENFGKLSGFHQAFSEGLTVINEENGWGKSTLAAFIRVMFFGFEGEKKRSDADKERKRLKPWQGGTYGGSLVFELGGQEYRIVRIFGKAEKDDEFKLYDNITGMISTDYTDKIGEEIFRIDSDSFMKTVLFSQNDMETSATDGINAKLGNLSESMGDIDNYEIVAERIKKRLNGLSHSRSSGLLYGMRNELTELENDTKRIPDISKSIETKQEAIDNLNRVLDNKRREYERLSEELKQESERAQLTSKKEQYENILKRYYERKDAGEKAGKLFKNGISDEKITGLISDYTESRGKKEAISSKTQLMESAKEEIEKIKKKSALGIILIVTGLVLIVSGTVLCVMTGSRMVLSAVVIGAAALAAGIIIRNGSAGTSHSEAALSLYNRLNGEILKDREYIAGTEEDITRFLSEFGIPFDESTVIQNLTAIKQDYDSFQSAKKEFEAVEKEKKIFEDINDIEKIRTVKTSYESGKIDEINEAIGDIGTEIEKIKDDIRTYNNQLSVLFEEMDELNAKKDILDEKKEEFSKLSKREKLITQTKNLLEEAKTRFVSKYSDPVARGFRKYYEILDGESGMQYHFDANMNLKVDDHGDLRNTQLYSAGSRDKIDLCFRMGLIEAMYPDEKPVIIMDDPFVNFDEKHLSNGKKILELLAEEYQIIYMTCHSIRNIY
ncbi:MAG: AAA family ATPase [Lachnospiraceae bacterium]|nr:AAA family ATPase [Lachnospiraceae bacterium]